MGRSARAWKGVFGTLNDGAAPLSLPHGHLPVKRNVEHGRVGGITKRPGRKMRAQVASFAENQIAAGLTNLGATSGSTLTTGTLYVRLTYSTVPGETDDVHSTTASIAVSNGDGVKVWVPFHIINTPVVIYGATAPATLTFSSAFHSTYLSGLPDDTFVGYYLYARDPSIQDETRLGVNPSRRKLWDRTNFLGIVSDYQASTGTFTLDRALADNLAGQYVDILMPDRAGHRVRAANVYVSQNANGPFYLYESLQPTSPITLTVTSVPTGNRQSPATRITRTAPTLAEVTVTDTDPNTGAIAARSTKMEGGEYLFRYVWETADGTYLDAGDWPEAPAWGLTRRPRCSPQEAWPSAAQRVAVRDGKGVTVTIPTRPTGVERAHIYGYRKPPDATLTFSGVVNPSVTHRAYHYSPSDAVVANYYTFTPAQLRVIAAEFGNAAPGPHYPGIVSVDNTFATPTSIGTRAWQFEFLLTAPQLADTSTATLVVRFKRKQPMPMSAIVRRWDNNAAAWVELATETPTDYGVTHRYGFNWTSNLAEASRAVFDIVASTSSGVPRVPLDVDYVALELNATSLTTDPSVTAYEVRQETTTTTSVTVKSRLVSSVDGLPIRPNTTAQWPLNLFVNDVPNYEGGPVDRSLWMASSADSVFMYKEGAFVRVYSQDTQVGDTDKSALDVACYDWQFAQFWSRVWFCNEAMTTWNMRFDGVQTHIMGLDDAATPVTVDSPDAAPAPTVDPDPHRCSRFTVKEFWVYNGDPADGDERRTDNGHRVNAGDYWRWEVTDPDGNVHYIYDYRNLSGHERESARDEGVGAYIGTVFEGQKNPPGRRFSAVRDAYTDDIIACLTGGSAAGGGQTDGDTGEVTATPDPDGGVPAGEYDYYVVHRRTLGTDGRGYTTRSRPRKVKSVTTTSTGSVEIVVGLPTDPQVTHMEFGRNLRGTPDVLFVGERAVLLELANRQSISFVDSMPENQMVGLMEFATGRPAAAHAIATNRNRVWFVPQFNKLSVGFTNITSTSGGGEPDLEGWWPLNTIVPDMPRLTALTALMPYHSTLLVGCDNGRASISGASDDLDSPDAISSDGLFADSGPVGPRAWARYDTVIFSSTRNGPDFVHGREVEPLNALVRGTVLKMNLTDVAARRMACIHQRSRGTSQVWFTYSDRADGRPDNVLVFDLNTGPGMEESRRLWSQWTEMYAHGLARAERPDGEETVLIGDHWGRLHEHGALATDNGIHIDAEIRTAPMQAGGAMGSFFPARMHLRTTGRGGDYVMLDVYRDLGATRVNPRQMRVDMGGTGTTWNEAGSAWNVSPSTWPTDTTRSSKTHAIHLGRCYHQMQIHFSQKWADQPAGAPRWAGFEMIDFELEWSDVGTRRARP